MVLAEKDAEIEQLRRDVANLTAAGRAVGRGHARQTARAEAAEAEVPRLRETVGRVEALWCPLCGATAGTERECSWCGQFRAALAPCESTSEAPRTRDGEQGGGQ